MIARRLLTGLVGGGSAVPPDLSQGSRVNVDTGTGYKSFPGMALRSGRLHLVYRHGSGHVSSDGVVKYRHSDDNGATWSAATTLVDGAGTDLRDPSITCLSTGRLVVGYDYAPESSYWSTIKVIYSDDGGGTWSSPYDVSASGMTYESAGTSPMLELGDGTVLLPAFGVNVAGGFYFSVLFRSSDHGATFGSQTTIAQSGSWSYGEPQFRLSGSEIICLLDSASGAGVWRVTSSDNGATWSAPGSAVLSAYGRTDWVEYYPGSLVMWCRAPGGSTNNARWTISHDLGLTWAALSNVDGASDDSMYAAPVIIGTSVVTVYSIENSSSDADLYCRTYTRV